MQKEINSGKLEKFPNFLIGDRIKVIDNPPIWKAQAGRKGTVIEIKADIFSVIGAQYSVLFDGDDGACFWFHDYNSVLEKVE